MELHPARLVLGLRLCAQSGGGWVLFLVLSWTGLAGGGLTSLLLWLVALGLLAGTATCATSISGAPRRWAVASAALLLGGAVSTLSLPASFVALFSGLGVLVCTAGMVTSLGRLLGDPTTAGFSRRALTTSVVAPVACAVFGGLLEGAGMQGVFLGLLVVAMVLGPTLFSLYTFYLALRLIPVIQSLKDGDKVGQSEAAAPSQF